MESWTCARDLAGEHVSVLNMLAIVLSQLPFPSSLIQILYYQNKTACCWHARKADTRISPHLVAMIPRGQDPWSDALAPGIFDPARK